MASTCLPAVPDYNCFASTDTVYDDKILVIVREDNRIISFVSCVLLEIADIGTVLHTGLTCVHSDHRRQGLQASMFRRLHRVLCREFPTGIWYTSVSSSLCSLASLYTVTRNTYPSPEVLKPSVTHLHIATEVAKHARKAIDVEEDVEFDAQEFLFYSSPDSVWWKDPLDEKYHHRNKHILFEFAK